MDIYLNYGCGRWPGPSECETCIQDISDDKGLAMAPSTPGAISSHLRKMYWSPLWILSSVKSASMRDRAMIATGVLARSVSASEPPAVLYGAYATSMMSKQWVLYLVVFIGLSVLYLVAYKQSKVSNCVNKRDH